MESLVLKPHASARSQAVYLKDLNTGDLIVSVPSLCSVIIDEQKSFRCDFCHRRQSNLKKCSGCVSYWYCDATYVCTYCLYRALIGQAKQWKIHHKKICKHFNRFTASSSYQALAPHEILDAILLSHLLVQYQLSTPLSFLDEEQYETLMSLLPSQTTGPIPTCPPQVTTSGLPNVYSRFSNNNFAIHSHLVTVGHGIFPLASRYFNHSCYPNAAARFILTASEPVKMEVVALRSIAAGEEICLPYVDPALSQTRHKIFEFTYGFKCNCPSCNVILALDSIPPPPVDSTTTDGALQQLIFPTSIAIPVLLQPFTVPVSLSCIYHESYLKQLSERFSDASHDGPYDLALNTGLTLLALYIVLYPPNYPQIGVHLLEMAKTAWNAYVTSSSNDSKYQHLVQLYLKLSRDVLVVFGKEGDEGGPLDEIQTLEQLLSESNE